MRYAIRQSNAHDDGIATGKVRVDKRIRRQVFVDVTNPIGRPPRRPFPVEPPLFGVTADGGEEPVQLLWIRLDAVGFENHRGRGDSATDAAKRAVFLHSSDRI